MSFETEDPQSAPPIPSTISREECLDILSKLDDAKMETLAVEGKTNQYINKLIDRLHPFWWKNMLEDLQSSDPATKRAAMSEYNKLQ